MKAAARGKGIGKGNRAGRWPVVVGALFFTSASGLAQQSLPLTSGSDGDTTLQSTGHQGIWEHGVGEGFRCGTQSLTLTAGATYGVTALGGQESHDLALGSLTYGVVLYPTLNQRHWYRGNLELRAELWGGQQFSPRNEWVVGLTPHLRYDFMTGTRWIPYIDVGAGVTATSIRGPDLGGVFEFNLQAGVGIERFLTDNVALTMEAGYMHMSSADIYKPNLGVNCVKGMAGVTFFF